MNLTNHKIPIKEDRKTYYSCQYHVLWCSKYKRQVFSPEIMSRLNEIIVEVAKQYKFDILELSIFESYVHLIVNVSPRLDIYKIVLKIKSKAKVLLKEFPKLNSRLPCLWSGANFIYSVGNINLDVINNFLEEQRGK